MKVTLRKIHIDVFDDLSKSSFCFPIGSRKYMVNLAAIHVTLTKWACCVYEIHHLNIYSQQ